MLTLDKRGSGEDFVAMLADIPRETICTVGGTPITIPVEVPPAVPIAYTRTRMNQGSDVAAVWAMELLMTSAGMNEFLTARIEERDLDSMIAVCIQRISGATTGTADEAPKASPIAAKTSRAPRRTTAPRSRVAKKSG
jgi:hypothetical protein